MAVRERPRWPMVCSKLSSDTLEIGLVTTLTRPPGSDRPYSTLAGPLTTSTDCTLAMLMGTPMTLEPSR